jgi:hypothetical protein
MLKDAGLTKKKLAQLLEISPHTVNGWGTTKDIPYWLESWLRNYIKAQTLDSVKDVLCDAPDTPAN